MNKIKQPSDVRGNQIRCVNYQMCPVCYGCRAYDSRDLECAECKLLDSKKGKKYHLCNKELHEGWKINKLISKNKVLFDEKIIFKNKGEN